MLVPHPMAYLPLELSFETRHSLGNNFSNLSVASQSKAIIQTIKSETCSLQHEQTRVQIVKPQVR